ncbi:16S rRNA (guanine(527)-N(7))-methyltransferase RsmG [Nakamurella silvestris]|nr:16S rRNA (guanine(527)-N(7))-methyltransferase RsmG [Nakamurella silvestris]
MSDSIDPSEPSTPPPSAEGIDGSDRDGVAAPVGTSERLDDTDSTPEAEPVAAADVFGDRLDLARGYVGWLVGAGVVRGLIGPREPARIWTRHVLNCAVAASLLPKAARVVDIGSGAGLPGIPWAIARPDCSFVLVEPLERRANYLLEVIADLGLTNARVVRGRAEDVVGDCGEADVVTSRAVAPLAKLAVWSAPLSRHGGEIIALKGATAAEEIVRDAPKLRNLGLKNLRAEEVGAGVVEESTYVVRATVDRAAAAGKRSSAKAAARKKKAR